MPRYDDYHVTINNCTVVWDQITRPETKQDNSLRYALKVVVDPSNPDLPVHEEIARRILNESEFRGVLPQGAFWASNPVKQGEFGDMFPGHTVLNCKSQFAPDVYGEDLTRKLESMQYAQLLYPGQKVNVLVHCYAYNNVSKGVATGLDAIQIMTSANAPKLEIGTGGPDAAQAFGGQAAAPAPAPAAAPPAPAPAPAHNMLPPQEVKYQTPDGSQWTEAQLQSSGWTPEQIQALPRV